MLLLAGPASACRFGIPTARTIGLLRQRLSGQTTCSRAPQRRRQSRSACSFVGHRLRYFVTSTSPAHSSAGGQPTCGAHNVHLHRCIANEDFRPVHGFYLPVSEGDIVVITEKVDDGKVWLRGYLETDSDQRVGRLPADIVSPVPPPESTEPEQLKEPALPQVALGSEATAGAGAEGSVNRLPHEVMAGLPSLHARMRANVNRVDEVVDPKIYKRDNWITDACSLLSQDEAARINIVCNFLFREHGIETAVVILDQAPGGAMNLRPFFTSLFNYWGVGCPAVNNGILVAMVMKHRRVEMVTGDGMRHVLTDSYLKNMQETYMVPMFKQGEFGVGLIKGTGQSITLVIAVWVV